MKIKKAMTEAQARERGYDNIPFTAGKGNGYIKLSNGEYGMTRCFECGNENYAMSVSSGICACCGFDANSVRRFRR